MQTRLPASKSLVSTSWVLQISDILGALIMITVCILSEKII